MDNKKKIGTQRKTASRLLAVQGIYQRMESGEAGCDVGRQIEELLQLYKEGKKKVKPNRALLTKLLKGADSRVEEINGMIARSMDEKHAVARMLPLQKAILQAAAYELAVLQQTPARVVINEYVTLAQVFLSDEETGFVNGVLNRMARELRAKEFS